MRRREFLWLVGLGPAASWPCSVLAQQNSKVYRIASVRAAGAATEISETANTMYRAFYSELRRLGYVEGQNLKIDRFSAEGRPEHYHELARDVIRTRPDVIFISSASLLFEFKAQTTTIPIVAVVIDPVALGIVASVARPGGNITGVFAPIESWGKRLSLLKEAIPKLSRVGLLVAPTVQGQHGAEMVKKAASTIGVSLVGSPLESPYDEPTYRRAFDAMVREGAEAIYVGDQSEHFAQRQLIVELAKQHHLPAIYGFSEAIALGGLMAYTTDLADQFLHAVDVIAEIFKGGQPGEIPFYQTTKFDLILNLKTAATLGVEFTPNLLARADEVVE
jgi:putative ABC transport system substrate-binding protein